MSNDKVATASNQTPTTPAAIDGNTNNTLERVLQLLLVRESGALEREAAEKERHKALAKQREKNQTQSAYNLMVLQRKCLHIKGKGRKASYSPEGQAAIRRDDPAIMFHRFIDGSMVIKCLLCQSRWKPGDTKEFLTRNGKKIPNHTSISWEDAVALSHKSTNTMTSSETLVQLANLVIKEEFAVPDGFEF